VLPLIQEHVESGRSFVCVNTDSVAEEEVKYTLDHDGYIAELSKGVVGGLGEAVGINFIGADDKATLIERLAEVDDQDYFERGLELAIEKDGLRVEALDISQFHIVEVDFDEDLTRANEFVGD
jgi:CDP-glycerol glycerophosphotransferase